ncbi:PaaI family thioesterase [Beijerinckia sp. L45]|uniref:PaaI family thioesterase n=1 Tax=Beijerinckia sp. L45 TaxID=1641855 RepID=UPI00131B3FD6|nr:PaaI family thioesterase [Beijerinckia sp. L45]
MDKVIPRGTIEDRRIGNGEDLSPEGFAALSGLDWLRGLLDGRYAPPPFSVIADVEPLSVEKGRIVFAGTPASRFYNPMGIVHGGWMGLLLDTAMACSVHSALPAGKAYATLEMKIVFVRAVREDSGPLTAEGNLLHIGSRTASAEGKIYDSKRRLVAHGSETCMIWDVRDRS